jgi:hypothetical protein
MAFWSPRDEEPLAALHELRDVLAEQRERRVGHDNIRLAEQGDAFGRTEVAALLKQRQDVRVVPQQVLDVSKVDRAVAIRIRDGADDQLVGGPVPRAFRDAGEVEERKLLARNR